MNQLLAQWHLQPTPLEARRIREALSEVLGQHKVPDADHFLLACAELIINLYRYPDPKPSNVIVRFGKDDFHWWFEVLDNGPTFTQFSQLLNDTDPAIAAENGMGLKLLAHYFSDFNYVPACYRDDACNLMLLCKPLTAQGQPLNRVLIVDDDPAYRAVLSAYLSAHYAVIQAESVPQAREMVLKYKPVLVICDIRMPGQDGTALFDQISYIPDVSNTAFVYLSGCTEAELIERAVSRPIDDYLSKPVDKELLLATIKRVLMRRSYLTTQLTRVQDEKITLGLQPRLPERFAGFRSTLRSLCPEPGGGDLLQLNEAKDSALLVFADLMGHGVTPKGFAYALAGYLKGLCSARADLHSNICGLLELLSNSFDSDPVLKETLATLMAVSFSSDGKVCIANAGHPFPILITINDVKQISVDGPLPGLGLANYEEYCLTLDDKERLLIFSDGFLDAGEPISTELTQTLKHSMTLPISAAGDYLLQWRLNDGIVADDLTLMLLEIDSKTIALD